MMQARSDGIAWLLHLDPDEMLLPTGQASADIAALLAAVPAHVPSLRFMNFEGLPEAADLDNRYEQVRAAHGLRMNASRH